MSIARLTWVLPIRKLPQHASHSQAFAKSLSWPACLDMLVGKLPNSISARFMTQKNRWRPKAIQRL
ncbi:MAG: hypothetical protein ACI4VD_02445, partial [Limosilactobacillus mucosae]